jgi:hypothetical protein
MISLSLFAFPLFFLDFFVVKRTKQYVLRTEYAQRKATRRMAGRATKGRGCKGADTQA